MAKIREIPVPSQARLLGNMVNAFLVEHSTYRNVGFVLFTFEQGVDDPAFDCMSSGLPPETVATLCERVAAKIREGV